MADIVEKTIDAKAKEPKLFNIPINAPEGRVYNLSGPANPSLMELKQVALRLFEEFSIENWKAELIKKESKPAEKIEAALLNNK